MKSDNLNNSRPIDVHVYLLTLLVTFFLSITPTLLLSQESNGSVDYTNPFNYFSEKDFSSHLEYFRSKEAFDAGHHLLAFEALQPLAEEGYDMPQALLGVMHEKGYGTVQDYDIAFHWYRLSAMQGNAQGQLRLATMYQAGNGAVADNVLAHMWFNIASSNGNFLASKKRDLIAASGMTRLEMLKAHAMARECIASGYQLCRY